MSSPLVSCSELAARLGEPNLLVCDCRNDLVDRGAGRRGYAEAHVPGARYVHLEELLSGPIGRATGRHPLPDPQTFAERMRALGLNTASTVVAYDAAGGVMAARLWWMLRWLGHESVAVLDGGWKAWRDAGYAVSTETPAAIRGNFAPAPKPWTVDAAFVHRHLGSPDMVLIDARAADRFRGENETLDPVGGHTPALATAPTAKT